MSRHNDPEIRREIAEHADLPLFAEQSFTKFGQQAGSSRSVGTGGSDKKSECPTSPIVGVGSTPTFPTKCEQARARRDDPATSHAASRSVVNLGRTRDAILDILRKHGPMTDETIARIYNVRQVNGNAFIPRRSSSGLRSRRKELCDMGFVEACGTGKTTSGRDCQIWKAL